MTLLPEAARRYLPVVAIATAGAAVVSLSLGLGVSGVPAIDQVRRADGPQAAPPITAPDVVTFEGSTPTGSAAPSTSPTAAPAPGPPGPDRRPPGGGTQPPPPPTPPPPPLLPPPVGPLVDDLVAMLDGVVDGLPVAGEVVSLA